jgi:peptidoglycan/LPS O-acetylase OafA/YrhL
MAQRELYIDRLRVVMTALVVLHHTSITYGASGGWFYHEVKTSATVPSLLLTMFTATNQAYFMGFFFLLAGYFTPPSLERKGYGRFLGDRFLRLGLSLLAFGLLLGPLTAGMVNAATGDGFWPCIQWLWRHKEFINGPLWFVQALLMLSIAYCGWRAVFGAPLADAQREARPVPRFGWWLLSAVGVGAAALAIRQFVPTGKNVIGLQLGYFAGYIYLFALGIAAWRFDWMRQLNWKHTRPWVVTAIVAWPMLPVAIALAMKAIAAGTANFNGGLSWTAIVYALWEPLVAWGLIAAWILVFRERMNRPSALWSWLGRRAYAVYIIHPVVLVGVSLLLRGWAAPALLKFGVVGLFACLACWLVADPLVRMPGVRKVI